MAKSHQPIVKELIAPVKKYKWEKDFDIDDKGWGALSQKFAEGLVGGIGGEIGSLLFESIFPDNSFDWDKLASIVSTIIEEKLDEQTLSTTADKMRGVISFMNSEYANLKKADPNDLDTLSNLLKPYDQDLFVDVISVFMSDDLAEKSIGNFMLAACTHFAVLQEEALVDPDHSKTPLKSGFAKTILNLVTTYSNHAQSTANKIINIRISKISQISLYQENCWEGICEINQYSFTDSVTGQQYRYNISQMSEATAQEYLNNYIADVRNQITDNMNRNVIQIVNLWAKLLDNPVPSKV